MEYLHETGEIYWLRSSKESIAVLNVDWMINLLKQVYHHEFDKKLLRKEIDFENVCEEMIEDCSFMRKNCGLISESILKPLWKCNNTDELFAKIIELFKKFNLTYPVQRDKYGAIQTFYFFPHLSKSKLPEGPSNDKLYHNRHITLQYIFKFFFPQFFVQRLALQFWKDDDNIMIYENGFETTLKNGVCLRITRMKTEKPNTDVMKIFVYFTDIDLLWSVLMDVLQHVHSMLSSYWKFCGIAELFVSCPKCITLSKQHCNMIRLMQFTGELLQETSKSRSMLLCNECFEHTFIKDLVPFSEHNFSES